MSSYLSQFHHQITGNSSSGRRLVFLHGVMGFAANWRRIAKAFESEFEVLAFDQRGHGRSFQPTDGYSPEDYADDLLKIIDELGWSEIYLVGHSMGARSAYTFADLHPSRVTRLVIEDMGASMNFDGAGFIIDLLNAVPVPFATKRDAKTWFDGEFMRLFAGVRHAAGLAAYLYANLTEDSAGRAVWRFYEPGIRESIDAGRLRERWDEIEGLRMPVLLVRGEYSKDLPRGQYEEILARNSRVRGVEIAGAGHWVHSDAPEEFVRVLRGFFGE